MGRSCSSRRSPPRSEVRQEVDQEDPLLGASQRSRRIVSTLDTTTDVARRPFTGRRARLGDLLLQGAAGVAALGATVLVGPDRLAAHQGCSALALDVRARVRHRRRLGSGPPSLRCCHLPLRHSHYLVRRAAHRDAARARDRALPHRALAPLAAGPGDGARGDARGGSQRDHRPLGHSRPRPDPARPRRDRRSTRRSGSSRSSGRRTRSAPATSPRSWS